MIIWVVWNIEEHEGSFAEAFFTSEKAAKDCAKAIHGKYRDLGLGDYFRYEVWSVTVHDTVDEWHKENAL